VKNARLLDAALGGAGYILKENSAIMESWSNGNTIKNSLIISSWRDWVHHDRTRYDEGFVGHWVHHEETQYDNRFVEGQGTP
jgi:hypothetical protein